MDPHAFELIIHLKREVQELHDLVHEITAISQESISETREKIIRGLSHKKGKFAKRMRLQLIANRDREVAA